MLAFAAGFILWALVHSLTAARSVKAFFRRQMGERAYEGLYRFLYNLFAAITFVPVLYLLATKVQATVLWALPWPYTLVALFIQLMGLIGLVLAFWQTDVWEFAGLRQAVRYLQGKAELTLPPRLVTSGMYAYVRHPLYFFSLLVIWFSPIMTFNGLVFDLLATLYFWVGSSYEERRLAAYFGEAYRRYQEEVPRLLPRFWEWGDRARG